MKIKKSELFLDELEILKENLIIAIKLRINQFFENSGDNIIKEISFTEIINSLPIFKESDEDFSTLCIDSVGLDNEKLFFTYSSELQNLKVGKKDDLSIDNAIDVLTILEELE